MITIRLPKTQQMKPVIVNTFGATLFGIYSTTKFQNGFIKTSKTDSPKHLYLCSSKRSSWSFLKGSFAHQKNISTLMNVTLKKFNVN